jgi:hypothetical protein
MPTNSAMVYQVRVQGRLSDDWCAGLGAAGWRVEGGGAPGTTMTTLRVAVPNQAALHGLLQQLRDLGLPLIALHALLADSVRRDGPAGSEAP